MQERGIPAPFVLDDAAPSTSVVERQLDEETLDSHKIHIMCQQRGARKRITTLAGLDQRIDFKRMLKHICKTYSCNGSIKTDLKQNKVIQLTGDKRDVLKEFLLSEQIVRPNFVVLHGL